jgi:hypothetical protein
MSNGNDKDHVAEETHGQGTKEGRQTGPTALLLKGTSPVTYRPPTQPHMVGSHGNSTTTSCSAKLGTKPLTVHGLLGTIVQSVVAREQGLSAFVIWQASDTHLLMKSLHSRTLAFSGLPFSTLSEPQTSLFSSGLLYKTSFP